MKRPRETLPSPPRARWPRMLALLVGSLLMLVIVTLGGAWWWAGLEGSLATALRWAAQSQPLVAEQVSGALRKSGRIAKLTWQDRGLGVVATDVALAWQPLSLLSGQLKLERFSAASLRIDDLRPRPAAPSEPPAALRLPLRLVLDEFLIGNLQWSDPPTFEVIALRGRYNYDGAQHVLELANAQLFNGRYQGRVRLVATGTLDLDAALSGVLEAALPGSKKHFPLAVTATANGPLSAFAVQAALRLEGAEQAGSSPQASATARVMPWAAQVLPEAAATFRNLDAALLWPGAPQTQLSGTARVRPGMSDSWQIETALRNARAGPWDLQRLPLEELQAFAEWRGAQALLIRTLVARVGGGRLEASGEWIANAASNPAKAGAGWTVKATLHQVNLAALHSQLAAQTLNARASVQGQREAVSFDAQFNASGRGKAGNRARGKNQHSPLAQLQWRDASAQGTWRARQAGGTLALTALQVRTDDAELNARGEFQPKALGGKGRLWLAAPGLTAEAEGELRPTAGAGNLKLQISDAALTTRWLRSLPGLGLALQSVQAQGSANSVVAWQNGWRDPTLQAKLNIPSLDWTGMTTPLAGVNKDGSANASASASASVTSAISSNNASALKFRSIQASLTGRLSQMQLALQGRVESNARRIALVLAAEAGGLPGGAKWHGLPSTWQALVRQLSLSVEDPALGPGAWRVALQRDFTLRWSPGAWDAGPGQASLLAPANASSAATLPALPAQPALLAWQATRWRPGELVTAGSLKGLPLAWIELFAGPQLAGAGLAGNLVFDAEWDAVAAQTLRLKAVLARSGGDISLQAETGQGGPTRVAAGVREARLSLVSDGNDVTLAMRWDTERAGTAEGQLRTRLQRGTAQGGAGGWQWPDDAPLSGHLKAQLPRIGAWSVLAPPGWRVRGSLATDLAISGTRGSPEFAGNAQADDLALRSVVDGIELGNGRLRARLDGRRLRINEFTLQGAGDKGTGGTLTAQGEAGWVDGRPQVALNIQLERLRASIRTDRQLTLSGKLQALLTRRLGEITGALRVDQARILLPDESRPELGDDVIVRTSRGAAAGQQGPAKTAKAATSTAAPAALNSPANRDDRALKIDVQLDLGSDFLIQGKGLDTRVRGTLALAGESLDAPRLTGIVNTFGGQYRAYGQRLDIEQGMLRFNGPINNPALDILAIRPNLVQRVGVQISGTALLPRVRLYAQPELPDAEKLSWLVVGRSSASGGAEAALLQQAAIALLGSRTGLQSGGLAASLGLDELSFRGASSTANGSVSEGAITLGQRFSRNFYAAYERSLSGALGTLYVFYDLSQRFTIRAQAGDQTAIELILTLPYD